MKVLTVQIKTKVKELPEKIVRRLTTGGSLYKFQVDMRKQMGDIDKMTRGLYQAEGLDFDLLAEP